LSLLVLNSEAYAEEELGKVTVEQIQKAAANVPESVTIEIEEMDGGPTVTVTYTGIEEVSVTLGEIAVTQISENALEYRAEMACREQEGVAYLEMWCVFGEDRYFSRGLSWELTGTRSFIEVKTPFYLDADQRPDTVLLGLRFEGPGEAMLRGMALWELNDSEISRRPVNEIYLETGAFAGILGSLVGLWSSIWCVVSLLLAWKGRSRGLVLVVTVLSLCTGVISLLGGFWLYLEGQVFQAWYGFILLGVIVIVNYGVLQVILVLLYRRGEKRRMAAMDLGISG
jgi:hypothetical protein